MQTVPETTRRWDAVTQQWRDVTVDVTPEPRRGRTVKRAKVAGAPRDLSGLSAGAPLPSWWRDTAFYDAGPLADMRSYVKAPAMRTHRAATVMPAEPGSITARKPSDRLDK